MSPNTLDPNKTCCATPDCGGFCPNQVTGAKSYSTDPTSACCLTSALDCAGYCPVNKVAKYVTDSKSQCCLPSQLDCTGICWGPDTSCCSQLSTCATCLAKTNLCGWCGNSGAPTGSCMTGVLGGPTAT
jgi:hypothetical protein